jgi:hypothetical protein
MYLVLTDETNVRPSDTAKFFTYGALLIPMDEVPDLDRAIAAIRDAHGYRASDELKFDTRARHNHVDIEAAKTAKNEVVEAAITAGCKFIVYAILHDIIANKNQDECFQYAINSVIARTHEYLQHSNDDAMLLVDSLPIGKQFSFLARKFTRGIEMESGSTARLPKIRLFGATCSNASNVSSAMDIVLGCWRYCINQPKNEDAARKMLDNLNQMLWHRAEGEHMHVLDYGLILRPKAVKVDACRDEYRELIRRLNAIMEPEEARTVANPSLQRTLWPLSRQVHREHHRGREFRGSAPGPPRAAPLSEHVSL